MSAYKSNNILKSLKKRELSTEKNRFAISRHLEEKFIKKHSSFDFILSPTVLSTIAIAVAPSGHTLCSTHGDHTVKVFLYPSGILYRVFEGHPRTPWTVKYHPNDSDIIASGCLGCEVRVWSITRNECINQIRLEFSIISLAFQPYSSHVIIASGPHLHLWDFEKHPHRSSGSGSHGGSGYTPPPMYGSRRVVQHTRNIRAVMFHPDGELIFAAAPDPPRQSNASFTPCRLYGIRLSKLLESDPNEPPYLMALQALIPQVHLYSDGGIDISADGTHLLTCAILYVPPSPPSIFPVSALRSTGIRPHSYSDRLKKYSTLLPIPPYSPHNNQTSRNIAAAAAADNRRRSQLEAPPPPLPLQPPSQETLRFESTAASSSSSGGTTPSPVPMEVVVEATSNTSTSNTTTTTTSSSPSMNHSTITLPSYPQPFPISHTLPVLPDEDTSNLTSSNNNNSNSSNININNNYILRSIESRERESERELRLQSYLSDISNSSSSNSGKSGIITASDINEAIITRMTMNMSVGSTSIGSTTTSSATTNTPTTSTTTSTGDQIHARDNVIGSRPYSGDSQLLLEKYNSYKNNRNSLNLDRYSNLLNNNNNNNNTNNSIDRSTAAVAVAAPQAPPVVPYPSPYTRNPHVLLHQFNERDDAEGGRSRRSSNYNNSNNNNNNVLSGNNSNNSNNSNNQSNSSASKHQINLTSPIARQNHINSDSFSNDFLDNTFSRSSSSTGSSSTEAPAAAAPRFPPHYHYSNKNRSGNVSSAASATGTSADSPLFLNPIMESHPPHDWLMAEHLCLFQLNRDDRDENISVTLVKARRLSSQLMKAVTSVKLSSSGRYGLIGYGVRSNGIVEDHPYRKVASEIVSLFDEEDIGTAAIMLDDNDEVNIAQFHPFAGSGMIYGTKRGKVRMFLRENQLEKDEEEIVSILENEKQESEMG